MGASLRYRRLLLVVSGGIAAYKSAELVRLARKEGREVTCVLTKSAQAFVTPLLFASLSGNPAYTDLFSLKDEAEMGHIRLARETDAILVAPATADFIAKAAHGMADDLATALLLASDKPLFLAPGMNPAMYAKPAVQRNLALLLADGAHVLAPEDGETACGESGVGRMMGPAAILAEMERTG
jgi:phosphopantothenoylcysteine decarboxylase/phosphopantothenate--cysteine ligase